MEHIIDAKNQKMGRLATKIANLLQQKNEAKYNPRLEGDNKVIVKNIRDMELSGKKAEQKVYHHHTGYMGHLKTKTYKQMEAKDPTWALRHAVRGMLPKNLLQAKRLKRLIIEK
jgi:large subunit ribosomal protein L13